MAETFPALMGPVGSDAAPIPQPAVASEMTPITPALVCRSVRRVTTVGATPGHLPLSFLGQLLTMDSLLRRYRQTAETRQAVASSTNARAGAPPTRPSGGSR